MNVTLFVSMLFCFQLFYWFVGRRSSRGSEGKEDYFLAGKSVRLFPLMMTFLATQVGGGVVLGASEEAYRFGWPVFLYPLGASLGLIMLGSGMGRRLAAFQVSTVAEIFEVAYGSRTLRWVASTLSVVTLFMILVAQIIASSKFLVSLGVENTPLFVLFWTIVIVYTAQGGIRAVISTDAVQAMVFSVVFLICFGVVLYVEPAAREMQLPRLAQFAPVSSKLCGWLFMPLLFMVIEQGMGQRCFAGASPKTVSRACLLAGVTTMVICVVPVFLGTLAQSAGVEVPKGGSVLMAMVARATNPWMTALVGCAVLAAIISTVSSLINSISSNLSNDFPLFRSMRAVKGATALISMGSIFFAFFFDNIIDVLVQSYELSVYCLYIPLMAVLWKKRGNAASAWVSVGFGALGFLLFRFYPFGFKEIASIALSWFGYAAAEACARDRRSAYEG